MSVLDKSVVKVAKATGTALEVGVQITEKVVHDAKPVVKSVLKESRKGIKKAREGTLKVAKSLKDDNE
jgi:hypothetical protein